MLKRLFFWIMILVMFLISFAACAAVLPMVAPTDATEIDAEEEIVSGDIGITAEEESVLGDVGTTTETDVFQPAIVPDDTSNQPDVETEFDITSTEIAVTGHDYVVNENSKKFHERSCYSAALINRENRRDFTGTREELVEQGYEPCENCNP